MKELNKILADNLIMLRKNANLTQLELAERLNYSDKAVSKWERAEAVPDVFVLTNVAEIFGVTLDYLVTEHQSFKRKDINAERRANIGLIVMLISFMGILVCQIVALMALSGVAPTLDLILLCLIFPLPLYGIMATVFTAIWCKKVFQMISVFALIALLTISAFFLVKYLTGSYYFLILAIIIPAEVIVYFAFRLGFKR